MCALGLVLREYYHQSLEKVKRPVEILYEAPYDARVRSYGQYCAVAKALDVVGDRWTLLIVRELLLRGSCRYTDLLAGLPGIATNLLAQRLRELEAAGVLRRRDAPPPVATALFELTPRGRELAPVLQGLGRWGGPLMVATGDGEEFRSHWLSLPVQLHLTDAAPDGPPVTIELRTGDQPLVLESNGEAFRTRPGPADDADLVLTGPPRLILGLLLRKLDLDEARRAGLEVDGDSALLQRVATTVDADGDPLGVVTSADGDSAPLAPVATPTAGADARPAK